MKVRYTHNNRGQSFLEFVLVLPIILMMFFMAIQFFLISNAKQLVNYAAYTACHYGSTNCKLKVEEEDKSLLQWFVSFYWPPAALSFEWLKPTIKTGELEFDKEEMKNIITGIVRILPAASGSTHFGDSWCSVVYPEDIDESDMTLLLKKLSLSPDSYPRGKCPMLNIEFTYNYRLKAPLVGKMFELSRSMIDSKSKNNEQVKQEFTIPIKGSCCMLINSPVPDK